MKKYLLAVDGYTMQGRDGYNSNTYLIEGNKFLRLKEQEGVEYMNLDNVVGGGESLDYDLIEFPDSMNVAFVHQEVKGDKNSITAAFDSSKIDEKTLNTLILGQFSIPETEISITTEELGAKSDLKELRDTIAENDFAQRMLQTDEDIEYIKEYFRKEADKTLNDVTSF